MYAVTRYVCMKVWHLSGNCDKGQGRQAIVKKEEKAIDSAMKV